MDAYNEAHLYVAAIRLLHHQDGGLPSLEGVCQVLNVSVEAGNAVCRNLKKRGIIEILEDPFSVRLAVANHLDIEKIPQGRNEENNLAKELEKFQAEKRNMDQKVANIQDEMKKKKQDMFSDIEAKLKKEMDKAKGN